MKTDRMPLCPIFLVVLTLCLGIPAVVRANDPLGRTPGTWFLGGNVSLDYVSTGSSELDTGPAVTTWEWNPTAGVFIRQGLALTAAWRYTRREMGDEGDSTHVMALGFRAFAGSGAFHPYIGLELLFQRITGEVKVVQGGLGLSLGLLIPLHRRLALDLGARFSLMRGHIELDGDPSDLGTFRATLGYLGVMATF